MDTWVGWIAAALRLEKPYDQKLLIPRTDGGFVIIGRDWPPQTWNNDFERRRGKNPEYLPIVNESKAWAICVSPESHNHVFCSETGEVKLCRIVEMKEVKMPRKSLGHETVRVAGGGWKRNHRPRYHRYLITGDTGLKDAASFAFGDLMQRNVCKKTQNSSG